MQPGDLLVQLFFFFGQAGGNRPDAVALLADGGQLLVLFGQFAGQPFHLRGQVLIGLGGCGVLRQLSGQGFVFLADPGKLAVQLIVFRFGGHQGAKEFGVPFFRLRGSVLRFGQAGLEGVSFIGKGSALGVQLGREVLIGRLGLRQAGLKSLVIGLGLGQVPVQSFGLDLRFLEGLFGLGFQVFGFLGAGGQLSIVGLGLNQVPI